MTKISSGYTAFMKKGFPVFWFGFIALFVAIALSRSGVRADPMLLIAPCALAVFGYFIFKKLVFDLVDEVYDCGDYLLIRNGGEEDHLALSNVMNVNSSTYTNPPRITLRLVNPGKFGSEVAFSPVRKFTLNPFKPNPVAEDLIVRVDKARSRRAR